MTPRTSAVPLIVAPRNPAWQPFEILPRYADPSGQLVPGSSSTQPLPPDTVIDGLPLQYRLAYNPLLPLSAYSPLLSPPNISHLPFFQPVTSLPKEAHHRKAIEKLAKRLARAGFRMRSAASGRSYTTYPTGGEGDDGDADEGNYLEAILPPVLVQGRIPCQPCRKNGSLCYYCTTGIPIRTPSPSPSLSCQKESPSTPPSHLIPIGSCIMCDNSGTKRSRCTFNLVCEVDGEKKSRSGSILVRWRAETRQGEDLSTTSVDGDMGKDGMELAKRELFQNPKEYFEWADDVLEYAGGEGDGEEEGEEGVSEGTAIKVPKKRALSPDSGATGAESVGIAEEGHKRPRIHADDVDSRGNVTTQARPSLSSLPSSSHTGPSTRDSMPTAIPHPGTVTTTITPVDLLSGPLRQDIKSLLHSVSDLVNERVRLAITGAGATAAGGREASDLQALRDWLQVSEMDPDETIIRRHAFMTSSPSTGVDLVIPLRETPFSHLSQLPPSTHAIVLKRGVLFVLPPGTTGDGATSPLLGLAGEGFLVPLHRLTEVFSLEDGIASRPSSGVGIEATSGDGTALNDPGTVGGGAQTAWSLLRGALGRMDTIVETSHKDDGREGQSDSASEGLPEDTQSALLDISSGLFWTNILDRHCRAPFGSDGSLGLYGLGFYLARAVLKAMLAHHVPPPLPWSPMSTASSVGEAVSMAYVHWFDLRRPFGSPPQSSDASTQHRHFWTKVGLLSLALNPSIILDKTGDASSSSSSDRPLSSLPHTAADDVSSHPRPHLIPFPILSIRPGQDLATIDSETTRNRLLEQGEWPENVVPPHVSRCVGAIEVDDEVVPFVMDREKRTFRIHVSPLPSPVVGEKVGVKDAGGSGGARSLEMNDLEKVLTPLLPILFHDRSITDEGHSDRAWIFTSHTSLLPLPLTSVDSRSKPAMSDLHTFQFLLHALSGRDTLAELEDNGLEWVMKHRPLTLPSGEPLPRSFDRQWVGDPSLPPRSAMAVGDDPVSHTLEDIWTEMRDVQTVWAMRMIEWAMESVLDMRTRTGNKQQVGVST